MSKRFELINFLNAHDNFKDNKYNKKLDSFDVVDLLNHYDELQNILIERDKTIADLEAKLAEKDKAIENWKTMYQSVMQSCHNGIEEYKRLREQIAEWERDSNATLNEYRAIKYENKQLNKALELAVQQLDDAKDMLREAGKPDWANTLDASAYYFKARAKEMKDE